MLSYEQINYAEKNLYNTIDDLKNCFNDLKKYCINKPHKKTIEREKIISKLYSYVTNGIPFENAKKRLCVDFDFSKSKIDCITNPVYAQYLKTLKPHKIYAAHKLHAAGIKNKDIAALINVTPQTVCKYLSIRETL